MKWNLTKSNINEDGYVTHLSMRVIITISYSIICGGLVGSESDVCVWMNG